MKTILAVSAILVTTIIPAHAEYIGRMSANPFYGDSCSNPYSRCGNPFDARSPRNVFGRYGNPFSVDSVTNPYGRGVRVYGGEPSTDEY